ncbi:MAG: 50S ribosomal protein L18e [Thermoplasmatota archaeon]
MRTVERKTNPALQDLIRDLRRQSHASEAPIWRDIAERLEKPTKRSIEVNVSRVNRYAGEGETVLVPGKLLAAGDLDKKVTVAAYRFSASAKEKVAAAGGKCLTIRELLETNPKGAKVRILG